MNKVNIKNLMPLPYAMEEAINRLRTNIRFLGKDVRKIMVISTLPNEGKSFVSMQLWKQMAETGSRSILVDMDLRKSIMVEKYDIQREDGQKMTGTSDYLSDDGILEDSIYSTEFEKGDILPNVENIVNPATLIENKRFHEMLDQLAADYRYVFVDVPPLELVSDGERIGSMCDGAILVVRAGSTSKRMIRNSIQQLERAGCPLLGIVLNRVESSKAGYYYKRYGRYGRYGGKYYNEQYYKK